MRAAMVEAKISAWRGSNAPGSTMPPRNTSRRTGSPALIDGALRSTATRTWSNEKNIRARPGGRGGGRGGALCTVSKQRRGACFSACR